MVIREIEEAIIHDRQNEQHLRTRFQIDPRDDSRGTELTLYLVVVL